MATTIAVANETEASMTRPTRDGRKLTYKLKVLQQPIRARACGSGAKSSADRRPVDPPPVVELKISEGDEGTDVTFAHNANFFLYTSLESARAIAPVRGSSNQNPQPVLTGMPVAGMSYLDRPVPAGYFVFSDLSVRHEGKYRLSFTLYEECKDPKDAAPEPPIVAGPTAVGANGEAANGNASQSSAPPTDFFHGRLEVKSEPFVVFSAKKFPGLAESTPLSRVVAEQGCRVRIRRDVRMRRRENKAKEFEDLEDETVAFPNMERYNTPDTFAQTNASQPAPPERPRSVGSVSVDASASTFTPVERRSSNQDLGSYYGQPVYHQTPAVPIAVQPSTQSGATHLSFGNRAAAQYQNTAVPQTHPANSQPPSPFAAAGPGFAYQQPTVHTRQVSNGSNYYYQTTVYPQTQYHQQGQFPDAGEYKPNAEYQRNLSSQPSPYIGRDQTQYSVSEKRMSSGVQGSFNPPTLNPDIRSSTPVAPKTLPPLATLPPPELRHDGRHAQQMMPTPVPSAMSSEYVEPDSTPAGTYAIAGNMGVGSSARTGKRNFESCFDTNHMTQSVQDGNRPEATGKDVIQVECNGVLVDENDAGLRLLSYRRADGTRKHKKIPSPVA